MKVFSSDQIRTIDQYTIDNEPIASIDLMERAAVAFVHWFVSKFSTNRTVIIFVGPGNNGGDGLAVGRLLYQLEYQVKIILSDEKKSRSKDCTINLALIKERTHIPILDWNQWKESVCLDEDHIIIDALFGTGLNRPIEGLYGEVIQYVNQQPCTKVAIDIPSGLMAENMNVGAKVAANYTFSFEFPKLAFFLPQNNLYIGAWDFLSIDLDEKIIQALPSNNHYISSSFIKGLYRIRSKFDHKGVFGHSLLINGSKGKMGAALLCAKACLRSGAGLLTCFIPKGNNDLFHNYLPEAMVIEDEEVDCLRNLPTLEKYKVVGIGCGIGMELKTTHLLKDLLFTKTQNLVLDADALNIIAQNNWLDLIPTEAILSPHPKEFERLFGKTNNDYERLELLRTKAKNLSIYIILKGAHTAVACPDGNIYFNSTGNPGMGTAGSGDVLTGVIVGLLSAGYSSFEASVLGVYIHGLAGDFAALQWGEEALNASDIISNLGNAFKKIKNND